MYRYAEENRQTSTKISISHSQRVSVTEPLDHGDVQAKAKTTSLSDGFVSGSKD